MICVPCKTQKHPDCDNKTTCPCQCRKTIHLEDGTVTPISERHALRMVEDENTIKVAIEEAW
jgi:hypothetical protein